MCCPCSCVAVLCAPLLLLLLLLMRRHKATLPFNQLVGVQVRDGCVQLQTAFTRSVHWLNPI